MSIIINDNIKVNAGKPIDAKYLNGITPYIDVAEVNTTIPISERSIGLTVVIDVAGVPTEYWYKNGVTNIDLIVKSGGGSDANFVFQQVAPATSWVVVHNLGKKCSVVLTDASEALIQGEIIWDNLNQVTINFNQDVSGYAYCN